MLFFLYKRLCRDRRSEASEIHALPPTISVTLLGLSGLEPPTSRLSGVRSNHLSYEPIQLSFGGPSPAFLDFGGDEEDRTPDPLLAGQVLSQLSYTPNSFLLWLLFAPFESLP